MADDSEMVKLDRIGLFDAEEIAGAIRRGDDLASLPAALQDSIGALIGVEHNIVEPAAGRPLAASERLALLLVLTVGGPGDMLPLTPVVLFERLRGAVPGIRLDPPS